MPILYSAFLNDVLPGCQWRMQPISIRFLVIGHNSPVAGLLTRPVGCGAIVAYQLWIHG